MKELWTLFWTFAKMGVMTFGGGMAMLPILQREVVENKHWATEEELTDYYAIGQCTPGIIAVNTATFIGQKYKGIAGGIVATLGVVFPSLVIISILAGLINNFADLAWVQNAFAGIAGGQRGDGCVPGVVHPRGRSAGYPAEELGGEGGMIYLRLFWEFFKTGLFAIGGGMATLPFLHDIGEATGWFTQAQLMNMLAVSESTPGPIGINMATYVGFTVAGVPGAVIATLGEVTPSIIVILIIAALLRNFRENRYVDRAFYGLRPASTGLIGAACVSVVLEVLTNIVVASPETGLFNQFQLGDGGLAGLISWPGLILAAVLLALTNWVKPTKNLHPIVFIAASAVVGVVFRFAGV